MVDGRRGMTIQPAHCRVSSEAGLDDRAVPLVSSPLRAHGIVLRLHDSYDIPTCKCQCARLNTGNAHVGPSIFATAAETLDFHGVYHSGTA